VRLLSDRMQEFIDWLEANTNFANWPESKKTETHKQLIICMISDPPVCDCEIYQTCDVCHPKEKLNER
jgi:hypothetical protein